MTKEQIIARTKTVTHRYSWKFLKVGDILQGVEKGMGLKFGEKAVKLALIRVTKCHWEPLADITQEDVIKEGFPDWTPEQFIQFIYDNYGKHPCEKIHRIEFEYLD